MRAYGRFFLERNNQVTSDFNSARSACTRAAGHATMGGMFAGSSRVVVAVFAVMIALNVQGCAEVKPVIRSIEEIIARELCEKTMSERPELLGGTTAQEICAIASVLQPFIDEIFAAKQRALRAASAHVQERPR